MKHKIHYICGKSSEALVDLETQVEKFCESVGFDNVIRIHPMNASDGIDDYIMIHYKSQN